MAPPSSSVAWLPEKVLDVIDCTAVADEPST